MASGGANIEVIAVAGRRVARLQVDPAPKAGKDVKRRGEVA